MNISVVSSQIDHNLCNCMDVDTERLRQLIAEGETFETEFKRATAGSLSDTDIIEAVACLANGSGGLLVLGVENDGSVTGAAPRHGRTTDCNRLRALITNNTNPHLAVSVSLHQVSGKQVIAVEVPDSHMPVGTQGGVFKRRAMRVDGTPECVPYGPHEMLSAGFSATGRDYAQVPVPGLNVDSLNPEEFGRFRSLCRQAGGDQGLADLSDRDICQALRLFDPLTKSLGLGAVLLFGDDELMERHVPTHEVLFQEMKRGRIVAAHVSRAPLFRAAADLEQFLAVRNQDQEVMHGLVRVTVPSLPPRVMREVVANALVHRDYAELGPISVRLDDSSLSVTSPGGLPAGISVENILFESKPRSAVLAEAFRRAGLVDRAGKGVGDIYWGVLRSGRGEPDYSRTTFNSVTVVIPTAETDLDMARFIVEIEAENAELPLLDLRLLHELKALGTSTPLEIAESLSIPLSLVRPALTALQERGIIEVQGQGRSRHFHLGAGFYDRARDREAYVRIRPIDPIQQAQMVLQYVESYGSITRGQAMTLCHLDAPGARRLLKGLVDRGDLVLRGERRGSHYVLPEDG